MGLTKEKRETAAARIERELNEGVERVAAKARAEGTAGPAPGEVVTRRVDPATIRPAKARAPGPKPDRQYPIHGSSPTVKPKASGVPAGLDLPVQDCARPGCPERFKPKTRRQKFCSTRCRENPEPRGFAEKECAYCHKPFTPKAPRQRYCTDTCRDERNREQQRDSKERIAREKSEDLSERKKSSESEDPSGPEPAEAPAAGPQPDSPGLESQVSAALEGARDFESTRARYLELLFTIAGRSGEHPEVRIDALTRLERLSGG